MAVKMGFCALGGKGDRHNCFTTPKYSQADYGAGKCGVV